MSDVVVSGQVTTLSAVAIARVRTYLQNHPGIHHVLMCDLQQVLALADDRDRMECLLREERQKRLDYVNLHRRNVGEKPLTMEELG